MDTVTEQTVIYEYPVRRPFDYDGTHYNAGDMWTPLGFRNDSLIIEYYTDKAGAVAKTGTPPPALTKRRKRK